jgi:ribose transport system substrate-binding protein
VKKILSVLITVLMALCLSSCGPKQSAEKPAGGKTAGSAPVRIAFVTNNVSDFWKIAEAGVKKGEAEFNATCDVKMPTQGTAAEQKVILEDMVTKGITGVAISPVNPDSQTDVLNKAAAKLNLICMDSDAPKSKRLCYVGTSNIAAGKIAGQQILKAIPNGGKIMLFVGTLDAQNAADRYKGIQEVLKTNPKYKILGVMTDDTNHTKARANVEDTLTKHADVACLVGLWSYNGPAIVNAVKAANKVGKVQIVCFDEQDDALKGVQDGAIHSTVVQKPYEFGYQSVKVLAALARGKKDVIPANGIVDTGVRVIDKSNIDSFWAELKKLTGKS